MAGTFLEALRGLPLQQQDPITRCQAQLTAFVRARAPEFYGYQGPLATGSRSMAYVYQENFSFS